MLSCILKENRDSINIDHLANAGSRHIETHNAFNLSVEPRLLPARPETLSDFCSTFCFDTFSPFQQDTV